jgi:hypothetical protein
MKKNKETRNTSYFRNLMLTKNVTKLVVYIVSGVLITVFILLGILALFGIFTGFGGFIDYFVLPCSREQVCLGCMNQSMFEESKNRWIFQILCET